MCDPHSHHGVHKKYHYRCMGAKDHLPKPMVSATDAGTYSVCSSREETMSGAAISVCSSREETISDAAIGVLRGIGAGSTRLGGASSSSTRIAAHGRSIIVVLSKPLLVIGEDDYAMLCIDVIY